jgi:double zinc ribbon protein
MILSDDIKYMLSNLSSKPTIKKVSAKPIVGPSLLEISVYKIKFSSDKDDNSYRNLNMMEIRPIELDSSILFYNKRNKEGPLLPISLIRDIKKISKYEGVFFKKKEISQVEISFDNQSKEKKTIRIDIEENKIDKFLQQINDIQNKLQNDNKKFTQSSILNFISEGGKASPIEVFPEAPFLSQGEEILWKNIITKNGLEVNAKVDYVYLVTNYRIFHYSYTNHQGNFILINQIKDIVIEKINSKSKTNDIENKAKENNKKDNINNNNNNNNRSIGDVTVTSNEEKPPVIFKDISDPSAVANIIKSLKKQCSFHLGQIVSPSFLTNESHFKNKGEIENEDSNIKRDKNNTSIQPLSKQDNLVCNNCRKTNSANSNFCNKCGYKLNLSKKCIKCNYPNSADAIFCNICGNKF